jgi:hypothetical protein
MNHTVTFEPLPDGATRHGINTAIAAKLRDRPGEWAHINTYTTPGSAASCAQQINSGRLAAYAPAGSFEAKSRTVDGERRVYARYVGPV